MVPSKQKPPPERPKLELQSYDLPKRLPLPPDDLPRRLRWAVVVSVIVNIILWWEASGFVRNHIIAPPEPIQVTLLPPPPKKPVVKKKIEHKVVKPPKPKQLPKIKPAVKPPPQHHAPPPPAPHHHFLTATARTPSKPNFTAPQQGRAKVGVPIEHEGTSPTAVNPAPSQPTPPAPTPPAPIPTPQPEPKPAPPAPEPTPKPAPPPPTGPTQDAQPADQAYPEIPDDLKNDTYKSYVRVKVEVHADGSFESTLTSSSGDLEIDQRVLEALRKWRWKPALKDGQPVDSTQYFKFEFEVQ